MACCLLIFSGEPIENDPRIYRSNKFQRTMLQSFCSPMCLITYLCPVCAVCQLRKRAIDNDMSKYTCCMGYFDNGCFQSGHCYEQKYPNTCLFLESLCCLGPSLSSTRLLVMDRYDLQPDPCDNRIVRFSNCLQFFSCICSIASIFVREFRHVNHLIHFAADTVFYTALGCMASQVDYELKFRQGTTKENYEAIPVEEDYHDYIAKGIPVKSSEY